MKITFFRLPTQWSLPFLSLLIIGSTPHGYGQASFAFPNGNPLDTSTVGGTTSIGATITAFDPAVNQNVVITTVDVVGQDGTTASTGGENFTNSTNSNALGINSDINVIGVSNETRDFNPGEAWVFEFATAVRLDEIDFAGWSGQAEVTFSSTAFSDLVLNDDGSASGDFDLGDLLVPANTPVTLAMTSLPSTDTDPTDEAVRLISLSVLAEPLTSTGANLEWNGGASGTWDEAAINFTDLDTSTSTNFSSDDNVTFVSDANVTIVAGGIVATDVSGANPASSIVTLSGGPLTTSTLDQFEAGTLQISNDSTTSITSVTQGTLELLSLGSLTTTSLLLGQGGTLTTASGSSLSLAGNLTLDVGGATINNESNLALPSINNTTLSNLLVKEGSGVLTISGGVGTLNSGPVALNVLDGSILFSGSATSADQVNLGNETTPSGDPEIPDTVVDSQIDGELILDGPLIMLHGSQLAGTGAIRVLSSSKVESRFNDGPVTIEIPITLDEEFEIRAPTGNSVLTVNGIISGMSNLNKGGNGLVIFAAANTYLGSTTITEGNLQLDEPFLNDAQFVDVSSDTNSQGRLILSHGQGDVVDGLLIDGIPVPPGTYGSSDVTAVSLDVTDDVRFGGTGWLVVTNGPANLEIVACGVSGDNFFIEVKGSTAGLIVTSSSTLDFANSSVVAATIDPLNDSRFLIPSSERTALTDFFRIEQQ